MVPDDKGRAEAERLALEIVLDPLAKPLAAVGQLRTGLGALRLGAAEQSEPHGPPHFSAARSELNHRTAIRKMPGPYRRHNRTASQTAGVPPAHESTRLLIPRSARAEKSRQSKGRPFANSERGCRKLIILPRTAIAARSRDTTLPVNYAAF